MPPTLAAVILAGGRGERLGGVLKAGLEIGGVTLLDRVHTVLEASAAPILIACGRTDPSRLRLRPGQTAIADNGRGGPLAGLVSAADWLLARPEPPDFLLSVAVDTPFLPHDYGDRLKAATTPDTAALVVRYAGQDYPTNALWRLERLAELREATAPPSLRRLAAALGAAYLDWPAEAKGDPFSSVNTPADLAAARARQS